MTTKTKILIAIFSVLAVIILLSGWWIWNNTSFKEGGCESWKQQIEGEIAGSKYCNIDSDCVSISGRFLRSYTFGCNKVIVNKNEADKLEKEIGQFIEKCNDLALRMCQQFAPRCINNECQIKTTEQTEENQSEVFTETSVSNIIENPEEFKGLNVKVSGRMYVGQISYVGQRSVDPGGIIMDMSLLTADRKSSIALSIKDMPRQWSEESDKFKEKYDGKNVSIEGVVEWSGGNYTPSISVTNIKVAE